MPLTSKWPNDAVDNADPDILPVTSSTSPEDDTSNNGNPDMSLTDITIPSNPSLTENNDPTVPSTSNIEEPEPLIFKDPDIAPDPVNGNAAEIPATNDAVAAVPCRVDPSANITSPDEDTVNIGIPDISLTSVRDRHQGRSRAANQRRMEPAPATRDRYRSPGRHGTDQTIDITIGAITAIAG